MSEIKGDVGGVALRWKSVPTGERGSAIVVVDSKELEVSWKKDSQGIRIELPHGVFGFDFEGEVDDSGRLSYEVSRRGSHETWKGLFFKRAGEEKLAAGAAGGRRAVRVRAQMPGKIIRLLIAAGASVEKDQPLLVMEAMKMENEIRSPQSGKVSAVRASEGQAVETGAELLSIEPTE